MKIMEKKTIQEWCNQYETVIMSYDGFRDKNENDLLTKKEFLQGMMVSTIQFNPKILKAFDELKDM